MLLAGGLGTRLREETAFLPKPMVPIGGKPIIWHIMKNYAHFGFKKFIVCTGYKGEILRQYFKDFQTMNLDFTIKIQNESQLISHGKLDEEDWEVTVADTGADTMTGGRLLKIQKYVGDSTFFCTYGDGLASVDLKKLLDFHKSHGKIATLTTVQPQSRFGILDLDEGSKVLRFKEKPLVQSWINAGFFVFEPEIFGYLDSNSVLESGPLNKLAEEGELMAFKHEGFWQPMDTYRESQALNEMWQSEVIPWKMWN